MSVVSLVILVSVVSLVILVSVVSLVILVSVVSLVILASVVSWSSWRVLLALFVLSVKCLDISPIPRLSVNMVAEGVAGVNQISKSCKAPDASGIIMQL